MASSNGDIDRVLTSMGDINDKTRTILAQVQSQKNASNNAITAMNSAISLIERLIESRRQLDVAAQQQPSNTGELENLRQQNSSIFQQLQAIKSNQDRQLDNIRDALDGTPTVGDMQRVIDNLQTSIQNGQNNNGNSGSGTGIMSSIGSMFGSSPQPIPQSTSTRSLAPVPRANSTYGQPFGNVRNMSSQGNMRGGYYYKDSPSRYSGRLSSTRKRTSSRRKKNSTRKKKTSI